MRKHLATDRARVIACMASFAFAGLSMAMAAGEEKGFQDLIVPKGAAWRHPTTEIQVGFGDVHHLSPWRVKRRFPRNGGARGGQLVTLRDAMRAINELVARDDEMPEHTFAIAPDGSLSAVCDIPVVPAADGASPGIGIRVETLDGTVRPAAFSPKLLDTPVRDFARVAFVRGTGSGSPPANALARRNAPQAAEGKGGMPKAGMTRTLTLPGGATMEMIWCEPGSFMMGSPVSEEGRFEDEPQHQVTLTKGFWLGRFEVTQAQWTSVMGTNPSRFKGPNRPVETVSWSDCQAFIGKVHAASGLAVRLPTEAEWEYACRAGSTGAVAGSGFLGEMAWYDENSEDQTHEVGIHQPNAWGFHDMHGNVLEWCSDWFAKPDTMDTAAVDPKGPAAGSFRMLRGGCWFYFARDCRSAYRLKRDPDLRNSIYGFRLACSAR